MKQEIRYLISDAAKKVQVESHVLRYWEEELKLPIKRNELGHRYYTEDDILRFKEVKSLKEQGLQLKAIRMILKDGRIQPFAGREIAAKTDLYEKRESNALKENNVLNDKHVLEEKEKHVLMVNSNELMNSPNPGTTMATANEAKTLRLQQLLQQMISDAVRSNTKELVEDIKETMLKELDYQFRLQEEREENYIKEKIERDEAHYQRIDEMLRKRSRKLKSPEKEKKMFRKS
ncbi:MAG: helix-turn-helix domain-containing protein [Lachnospiraceae bacterium]|nr:helix-turn-helix domain-containing protein [Lachnospiraceae bacterium]